MSCLGRFDVQLPLPAFSEVQHPSAEHVVTFAGTTVNITVATRNPTALNFKPSTLNIPLRPESALCKVLRSPTPKPKGAAALWLQRLTLSYDKFRKPDALYPSLIYTVVVELSQNRMPSIKAALYRRSERSLNPKPNELPEPPKARKPPKLTTLS